ncbi:hypothetical protein MML48_8g00010324 [Holotrichia oblita]|uniref:Uncharacterized protein n=1 Tax=Holotrichia oblita TaxID=644536 RepID=A0ACB9SRR4_HOLOL|nr:hypothetical protein MML48_8g00010324 [Holotrichia oblita]
MTKCYVLVLTCLWIIPNSLSSSTETISPIGDLVHTIIHSNWKTLEDRSDLISDKTIEQKQARIFQKIQNVTQVLRKIEEAISSISYTLFFDVALLAARTTTEQLLFCNFFLYMQQIEIEYDRLQMYSTEGKSVNSTNMINFAKAAVSDQFLSTLTFTERIDQMIVPKCIRYKSYDGILQLLTDNEDAFDEISSKIGQSPNQLLCNFFNKIAIVRIKGYAVIKLSYAILEIHEKGYYLTESNSAIAKIRKKLQELVWEIIPTAGKLSRHYWRSDPKDYIRGENYLEISRLLQGYIVNENILNKGTSCYGQCDKFDDINIVNCKNDPFCRKQPRCNGNVHSCRSIQKVDMHICLAPTGTSRRYDYIEYKNHETLGVKSNCPTPIVNVNAWIRWCPYCMCYCDDAGVYSHRFFSLRPAVSDTNNNKVVTGIRFVKRNRMIHLQVQQGEILPYGVINATSLEWVPINNFKITDRYVHNKQDYLKMTWKDKAVDLHVIEVDNKDQHHPQVLTGVRFSAVKSKPSPRDERFHLNLEIQTRKLNFKSGKLFPLQDASVWLRNTNTEFSRDNPRTKIPTGDLDIPTRAKSKNTVVSKGNQFVEFAHTDMIKDAGQTTIPFIDSQDVVTKVPTPLIGAGLYYKSIQGYGGFIGLKIVTYDFTQHL